jgi:hypothetical protein
MITRLAPGRWSVKISASAEEADHVGLAHHDRGAVER